MGEAARVNSASFSWESDLPASRETTFPAKGNSVDLRDVLLAAIDEVQEKHAAVAACMDVQPAYLSRIWSKEKPLPPLQKFFYRLSVDVRKAFLRRLGVNEGLVFTTADEIENAVFDATEANLRMLRLLRARTLPDQIGARRAVKAKI